jgi:hypothetical protein
MVIAFSIRYASTNANICLREEFLQGGDTETAKPGNNIPVCVLVWLS